MSWSSKLLMSSKYRIRVLRRSALVPFTFLIAFTAMFVSCSQSTLAAALSCGTQPEILPADVAKHVDGDAEEKTDVILHAPASVNLRGMVATQRRELRNKYPSIDTLTLDHYLLWTTCRTISSDPMLGGGQKFDMYSNLYRLMSEPIKAAPAAE